MHDMNEIKRLKVSTFLVDARGKACPAPIIELARALQGHPEVELWADDPAAGGDLHAFCDATGHWLIQPPRADATLMQAVVRHKRLDPG